MTLNKQTGNMYQFVDYTWNVIKGECPHDCSYCYMKSWGNLPPIRFDGKELSTDLVENNTIFVGSSCDMWASFIPTKWLIAILMKCNNNPSNRYLFQTKNPYRIQSFGKAIPENSIIVCTIESNKYYPKIMKNAPSPKKRYFNFNSVDNEKFEKHITIEPILKFSERHLVHMINIINPNQVNIGADSQGHDLPEPSWGKIQNLIKRIKQNDIKVHTKDNLKRLKER